MTTILIEDDEAEQIARQKHRKRVRYFRYAFAQAKEALGETSEPFYYLLEGLYHNGETVVPVQMSGSSLHECVQKLKDADPNFGEGELSFTGGWVCPDYDVTRQVRDLV